MARTITLVTDARVRIGEIEKGCLWTGQEVRFPLRIGLVFGSDHRGTQRHGV
ncbi:hypothetical protein [uncultured Hoeflea sp.]|uniref:hypothetical protein n=1 Tax=uncultured Hoeflea sp. TaxID=538666 RepID=UPI0030DD8B8C